MIINASLFMLSAVCGAFTYSAIAATWNIVVAGDTYDKKKKTVPSLIGTVLVIALCLMFGYLAQTVSL